MSTPDATTNHTYTGTAHSRSCDCKNPFRPHGHDPGCLHYRPLKAFSDAELAEDITRREAAWASATKSLDRHEARVRKAYGYYLWALGRSNAAERFRESMRIGLILAAKERAARQSAPRGAAPNGITPDAGAQPQ